VLEARDGTLWVATDYKLNRLNADGSTQHIGVPEGLPSNTIYSLLEDGSGNLWIATNNGLAKYSPATGKVNIYDAADGLQSNEFNSAASFRSHTGEMFFGGINGFNAFYPSSVVFETQPPSVAITKFFKFNREVPLDRPLPAVESLPLSWQDSVIGFEFAVFDFIAPEKNRFRYRLEGFDRQWLEAVGHNHVTYTNLDPGEYVLRVQGANRHGVWSKNETTLALEISPPPWSTWWAYALYVLAAISAIAGGLRFHYVRMAEKHQLENEQQKRRWAETLQQLTQALASSLNGGEIAEELLENLRVMVSFRKAVLFVEQGVEIHVAGAKGFRDDQGKLLDAMPASHSRFFAEVRHSRQPRVFTRNDVHIPVLQDDMTPAAQFLAIPAYSRADEFALLLIGRDAPLFSAQECDIVSAFLTQALVSLDNARLFAELQNLATIDTLTQVHNRRYFFELAELEFARGKRYGRDVALILLDADNFKKVNDNYGREIGDRMLKIMANSCRNNLRHFDIIGRYGGEDFIIMLPETPMNVAADVADRVRKSIESIHMDTHKGELTMTVSVGVAVATENVPDLPALINRADMALYEAKRAGRNKVVVAER
ncbi:MAG TPA: diguanylate cyclase, partial [Gammaproteobacteria bacterium]